MKVFLVRHAHAGDREAWKGEDRLRPLSEKGKAQALGLVRLLTGETVGRVLSSPFLRCVQTVQPLAATANLSVEPELTLAEGSDWHDTLRLALDAVVPTVMCSQGDVIGDFVMELIAQGLVRPHEALTQKGSTWALTIEAGRVASAVYHAPPRS